VIKLIDQLREEGGQKTSRSDKTDVASPAFDFIKAELLQAVDTAAHLRAPISRATSLNEARDDHTGDRSIPPVNLPKEHLSRTCPSAKPLAGHRKSVGEGFQLAQSAPRGPIDSAILSDKLPEDPWLKVASTMPAKKARYFEKISKRFPNSLRVRRNESCDDTCDSGRESPSSA